MPVGVEGASYGHGASAAREKNALRSTYKVGISYFGPAFRCAAR